MRPNRLPALGLLILSVLLASGCELFSEGEGILLIKTDRDAYAVDSSTVVQLRITNDLTVPLHYTCTIDIWLEEWNGSEIVYSWPVDGFHECAAPGSVLPQTSRTWAWPLLRQLRNLPSEPRPRFDDTVQYRFKTELYGRLSTGRSLTEEEARSNVFTIIRR